MCINPESIENLKRIGGDGFLEKIITVFLEIAPPKIEQLRSSVQAGDLESAGRAAHSLKSSVSNFGAHHATGLAHELEALAKEGKLEEVQPIAVELENETIQVMERLRTILQEENAYNEKSCGHRR